MKRPKRTKPPGTHSKSPHGHQKSFKIAKKSNRTSQHRYVRNFYLAFTCRFEFRHICERLCIMVAHLDRLMNVVTNENGVLRRWHTLYVFESHKVSKTKVLNKSKKYHAMEWIDTIDCSFPGQFCVILLSSWSVPGDFLGSCFITMY